MDQNNLKNFLQLLIRKQQEETARQKARDSIQMKEIEKITCLLQSTLPVTQESSSIPLTKMTPQDDPAAFLKTFERLARHNHWPEETWALRLAPLLCGEAQLAYAGLADTDALTYAKVKETILRHFKTASDLYRQEFRSLKMLPGACPRFVAQRLNDLANLWLKPVETEKMKLFDKVVLEQFLNILPKETQEWVKMLQPEDLESAVIYTESFAEGTESVSESTGQVASEPRMSPASSHMAGYVLPAAKIASSIGTAPPRQREQIVPPYLCDENINTVRAGADGVQMNLSLQWKGKKKCNEDHAFIPRKRYRPENDEQFQKYYNMEEKSRIVITKMHEKLQYLFNNEENETAFVSELKEKITNLKQKHLYEEMFIGIFGKTGTGKSSLINALLNEKTLLPTSSRKACTSCIIQVQVHENNRLVYKAEIEFISKEEWEEELKELIENCKQDHNEDSSYTEDGQEAESELAKEKIMAVYGKDGLNKSFFELANLKILDTLKGSKVFFSKTGSELSEKINQYIRSESDDETSRSYWPLVKVVKLHVPKACGLPDQVVLVDIPGTGDSNKDRNKMWKEYISKCNSIWIVTDITRAESDRNALEILNTGLRGIAGGGECQNITYICTKTDEIGIQMGIQSGHKTQRISGHAEPDDDSKLKRDTILMRNTKVKEKINDKCNKIVKGCTAVRKLGSDEDDNEERVINESDHNTDSEIDIGKEDMHVDKNMDSGTSEEYDESDDYSFISKCCKAPCFVSLSSAFSAGTEFD
ncbi:uncharacterized protein LOC120517196 [Polypterus senegalus]|uniref:uncharacterized protein LOC120517196 n=1 Tax=Polypterus senegalus TaxID=55291 RepID=UPI00196539E7|nr:uncharacterized protein LOC120517196 [Polypterus senegalus]